MVCKTQQQDKHWGMWKKRKTKRKDEMEEQLLKEVREEGDEGKKKVNFWM